MKISSILLILVVILIKTCEAKTHDIYVTIDGIYDGGISKDSLIKNSEFLIFGSKKARIVHYEVNLWYHGFVEVHSSDSSNITKDCRKFIDKFGVIGMGFFFRNIKAVINKDTFQLNPIYLKLGGFSENEKLYKLTSEKVLFDNIYDGCIEVDSLRNVKCLTFKSKSGLVITSYKIALFIGFSNCVCDGANDLCFDQSMINCRDHASLKDNYGFVNNIIAISPKGVKYKLPPIFLKYK